MAYLLKFFLNFPGLQFQRLGFHSWRVKRQGLWVLLFILFLTPEFLFPFYLRESLQEPFVILMYQLSGNVWSWVGLDFFFFFFGSIQMSMLTAKPLPPIFSSLKKKKSPISCLMAQIRVTMSAPAEPGEALCFYLEEL